MCILKPKTGTHGQISPTLTDQGPKKENNFNELQFFLFMDSWIDPNFLLGVSIVCSSHWSNPRIAPWLSWSYYQILHLHKKCGYLDGLDVKLNLHLEPIRLHFDRYSICRMVFSWLQGVENFHLHIHLIHRARCTRAAARIVELDLINT